jgi:transcriptional regulator with XRE-family HTH domain
MRKYAPVLTPLKDRIREVRGEKSQVAFAEKVGVDPITVSRWERGEVKPSAKAIFILCRDFGMSIEEFEDVA